MLIVKLIVLVDLYLAIGFENIFSNLLITAFEVVLKIFQNVCLVGLEVELQEHVMGYDHCQRNPVERTFLNTMLKKVRMIANLFQTHQHVHHTGRFIRLLLAIFMPNDLII
jgi:hypothetical protein